MGSRRWRSVFTLLELIVVMAVIFILISLILPAVQTAKSKAHQIRCLGNLRQIGIAASDYADNFDGLVFPAEMAPPYGHWLNYITEENFQGKQSLVQCPVLGPDDMFNPYGGDGDYAELKDASYIMNIIREESVHGWSHIGADISTPYARSFGWISGNSTASVMQDSVKAPESKIFITDSAQQLTHSSTAIGILRLHETDHGIVDPNGNEAVNAGERQVGFHHSGRFNALFGDLHVESRKKSRHEEWNAYQN